MPARQDPILLSVNSRWVVRLSLAVNDLVKWRYGRWKHMAPRATSKKCSLLNRMM